MQYLAFDIECANQYVSGSMCSLGVVVADENFNILHSEDIIINPKCRIFDKHCKLVYEPALYSSAKNFAELYPYIKHLMEQPDTMVLGHAVSNDVKFLDQALRRYSLPVPRFNYVCTQLLYREFAHERNSISVESAAEILQLENLTSHKAVDDAFVSLMLLKYLMEQTGKSLADMLASFKMIAGRYSQHGHLKHLSAQQNKTALFQRAVKDSPKLPKLKKEKRAVTKFCFDPQVWAHDVDFARDLLYSQFAKGWSYVGELSGINYYVVLEKDESARLERIKTLNTNGSRIAVITADKLERTVYNNYSSDLEILKRFA